MKARKRTRSRFAIALRDAREAAGLSQATLAVTLGMAPSTIHRLETGVAPPSWKIRRRLVERFPSLAEHVASSAA